MKARCSDNELFKTKITLFCLAAFSFAVISNFYVQTLTW